MDKSHKKCLILWLRIQDWADCILHFVSRAKLGVRVVGDINVTNFSLVSLFNLLRIKVKDNGFEDSVMSVDDLRSGIETRGTGNRSAIFLSFFFLE